MVRAWIEAVEAALISTTEASIVEASTVDLTALVTSLIATEKPIAAPAFVPLSSYTMPAPPPSASMSVSSDAYTWTMPPVAVKTAPPVTRASTVFSVLLYENEPPNEKSSAPLPPIVIAVTSPSATASTRIAGACNVASSTRAVTVSFKSLRETAAPTATASDE